MQPVNTNVAEKKAVLRFEHCFLKIFSFNFYTSPLGEVDSQSDRVRPT